MKRITIFLAFVIVAAVVVPVFSASAVKPLDVPRGPKMGDECVWIKDGDLEYSTGHYLEEEPLMLGFDMFGYNYQGMMFNGSYANAYLGRDGYPAYDGDTDEYLADNPLAVNHWTWDYRDDNLMMKWNEGWLSNKDCNGDGLLDRHLGHDSYIGSGAWLTNHMSGEYMDGEELCKWNYFVKIVAVPSDAYQDTGMWYSADGIEIGEVIWGEFAVTQEISNDSCTGDRGMQYVSPMAPGLGVFKAE